MVKTRSQCICEKEIETKVLDEVDKFLCNEYTNTYIVSECVSGVYEKGFYNFIPYILYENNSLKHVRDNLLTKLGLIETIKYRKDKLKMFVSIFETLNNKYGIKLLYKNNDLKEAIKEKMCEIYNEYDFKPFYKLYRDIFGCRIPILSK